MSEHELICTALTFLPLIWGSQGPGEHVGVSKETVDRSQYNIEAPPGFSVRVPSARTRANSAELGTDLA